MKVLLVDDEAPARERLRRLIEEFGRRVRGGRRGRPTARRGGRRAERMPTWSCSTSRCPAWAAWRPPPRWRLEPPPAVVLVTAYSEYALDAFEHQVADYLVKPVRRERLRAALERLPLTTRAQRAPGPDEEAGDLRRHLSAQYRGGVQTVPIDDVLYLLAEQKYVTVRHSAGACSSTSR
jgi:two-component system response regulator AlgR